MCLYNTIATNPGDKTVSPDGSNHTSAHNLVPTTVGRHCSVVTVFCFFLSLIVKTRGSRTPGSSRCNRL